MNDDVLNELSVVADLLDTGSLILLLLGLISIWLLNLGIRRLSARLMQHFPSRRFVILQMSTLLSFFLYIVGTGVLLVGVLHPPKEFLIAIGGSMAVAIGFALKDVAASLVSGLLLLFDRPFQVGDRVAFNDVYGEIVSVSLRSVRLQTLDDNLVTIPNARFITDVVSSGNAGAMDMMVVTDFHLALDADILKAQDLVRQVIVTSRYAYLKKNVSFALQEVEVAERIALRLRAKAYVFDVHYEKDFQSDITLRVTRLFQEHGIKRPMGR